MMTLKYVESKNKVSLFNSIYLSYQVKSNPFSNSYTEHTGVKCIYTQHTHTWSVAIEGYKYTNISSHY